MEQILRKEELKSSSTKKPKRDGDLQLTLRESQMKTRALKTASTRRVEFLVTVDSNLGAVVGAEEGAFDSIPGNEGRLTHAWVRVGGGMLGFLRVLWALRRLDSEE